MWACRYIMSYIRRGPSSELRVHLSLIDVHCRACREICTAFYCTCVLTLTHQVMTAVEFSPCDVTWVSGKFQTLECVLAFGLSDEEGSADSSVRFPNEVRHPIKPRGWSLCWLLFLFLLAGQLVFSVRVLRTYQKGRNDLLCYYGYLKGHFKIAAFFWQWACLDH